MKNAIFGVTLFFYFSAYTQNPLRFEKEVQELIAGDSTVNRKDLILFTGSSSIRLWNNLSSCFPEYNVLNRGFGGSHMRDLLFYSDKLIKPYSPKMIFIYEGDNDMSAGKSPEEIIQTADSLLAAIRKDFAATPVIFISPKPSVTRWQMKDTYELYNKKFKAWTRKQKNVAFADVWTPMLDKEGNVLPDLFVEDNLHMNKKGYDIWTKVLVRYIRKYQ